MIAGPQESVQQITETETASVVGMIDNIICKVACKVEHDAPSVTAQRDQKSTGSTMSPPPRRNNESSNKKDTLLRPKTVTTKHIAKMAPIEVWDTKILPTFHHRNESAKRAKAILLAQHDPEANISSE